VKVVVVGNGTAGNEVAFSLRERDARSEIAIISAEDFPEYDPCSLTYFVGGDVPRDLVFKKKSTDYQDKNISLILNNRISSIDSKSKKVVTKKGEEYAYDKLVLAHGGTVVKPPISGLDKQNVFYFKLLRDADRLSRHDGKTAVVIGSGAIGVAVAEAMKKKGCEVTIVELLDWILPTMFDEPIARRLEEALTGYGFQVLTGEKVLSIEGDCTVTGVTTNHRKIQCDTVVLAAGVAPNTQLATTAGIEANLGIRVDKHMETNIKDIYACGDCAESLDACTGEFCNYQLKHNAIEQARIVVRNILGENAEYSGAYPRARFHFFDTHAATFGKTMSTMSVPSDKEVIHREYGEDYLWILLQKGRVLGAQAMGKVADDIGLLLGAMWRGDNLNELRRNWANVAHIASRYPWTSRKLGRLMGLSALDVPSGLDIVGLLQHASYQQVGKNE